jgi:signal transduction histidine kinase
MLIFILASTPLFVLEYFQHEEALQLALNSGANRLVQEQIPQVLKQTKVLATLKPELVEIQYKHFQTWLDIQKSLFEWENLKPVIESQVNLTSRRNAIILIIIALIISYFVARSITQQFENLLQAKLIAHRREAELHSLSQWQITARTLVHELRGPLTPVKLVASAIAEDIDKNEVSDVYRESVHLSLAKIQQMETMIQKFMTFAKLPDTQLENKKLTEVLTNFVEHYAQSFRIKLTFASIPSLLNEPNLKLDESMLHNAFFALCQNALEALPDTKQAQISFQFVKQNQHLQLIFSNTGTVIPDSLKENLFKVGSSSKLNRQKKSCLITAGI